MASSVPLSLETPSHSFPNSSCPRAQSYSHSSSTPPKLASSSTPSLYVTFKVLQLVNGFRKRVETRVHATRIPQKASTKTATASSFCQDFERQAFAEIDRYLGRKTVRPCAARTKTVPKRQSLRPKCTEVIDSNPNEVPSKDIKWYGICVDRSRKQILTSRQAARRAQ